MARCDPPIICDPPRIQVQTTQTCECPTRTYVEVDDECVLRASLPNLPMVTISILPAPSNVSVTVFYRGDLFSGGPTIAINNGDTVPATTRVTYRGTADEGYYVSRWLGLCQDIQINFPPVGSGATQTCRKIVEENAAFGLELERMWRVDAYWIGGSASLPAGNMQIDGEWLASRRTMLQYGAIGREIVNGGTVTLTATPAGARYVSDWGNAECNNQGRGDPSRPGEEKKCALTPTADVAVNVNFAVSPIPKIEGPTVFLLPTENGALSANRDDDPVIENGETVPEGATVRFVARPAEGYYASRWTGDCAGRAAGHSGRTGPSAVAGCGILNVTTNVTVGVEFARPRRVSLSHSAGGTLTARSLPGLTRVFNGGVVDDGATVSITATPDSGYEISMWSGDCDGTAKSEADCVLTATVHLSASVSFSRMETPRASRDAEADEAVSPENRERTLRAVAGYFGFGHAIPVGNGYGLEQETFAGFDYDRAAEVISIRADNPVQADADLVLALTALAVCADCNPAELTVTIRFSPVLAPPQASLIAAYDANFAHAVSLPSGFESGGTLAIASDASGGFDLNGSGMLVRDSALTLTPGGYEISLAYSHADFLGTLALEVGAEVGPDCAGEMRLVSSANPLACGECDSGYGDLNGHCVPADGNVEDDAEMCGTIFLGDYEAVLDDEGAVIGGVCSGIDINDTFCFLGSADALPCQGLFIHVRDCNLKHNRPALDPWHCGKACADGKSAVGARCVESE